MNKGVKRTVDILSNHDIVFRSPICSPIYGLPIGDGDTGCLLWLTEDSLHVQVNNTALIDDFTAGDEYCARPDENMTFCRNGAQMNVRFGCPVFETIYQDKFEARLSMRDAAAYIEADTPFAKVNIKAFASCKSRVTILKMDADFPEAIPIRSELNRWGSRSFKYWYSSLYGNAEMGLAGISSLAEDGVMYIMQKLHGRSFAVAVKPICRNPLQIHRLSSRAVEVFEKTAGVSHIYYITVAVGKDADTAKEKALNQIREAERTGAEEIYGIHVREWEDFWNKSYVSLPKKMDYIENLWYLNLYYANSQMKGKYPAYYCNGIWGAYHDFMPWGGFFHYNSQHSISPLEAANHPELTDTYYQFRRNQLPYARRFAENIKKGKGAFYTEACDYMGRMDPSTKDNCTPGSQIAMEAYQHYLYTGDEMFFEETALPLMREAAEYYLDKLTMAEDGHYHIYATNGYESPFIWMDDCITDMTMIRVLFAALIPIIPEEEAGIYQERLDRLAPYQTADFMEDELDDEGRFLWGIGKGRKALSDHVLSVGNKPRLPDDLETLPEYGKDVLREIGKEKARKTYGNQEHSYYGFPDTEMSLLFPAGIIGIRDRDSELYKMIYNSICLHPEICMGWCMMPIYLARMGMSDMLEEQLERVISAWMTFPQGFGTYGPYDEEINNYYWRKNSVRNYDTGEMCTVPQWKFQHFDYETLPIIATAINEMLLQSYDGTLRLFPAIDTDETVAFRLAASGGRIVDAVYQSGECEAVIECIRGGRLILAVDYVKSPLVFSDAASGELLFPDREGDFYHLDTVSGQCICVKTRNASHLTGIRDYERNMDVKHFGKAKLGTEKEF